MGYYGIYGQSMAMLYSMALKTGFADVPLYSLISLI